MQRELGAETKRRAVQKEETSKAALGWNKVDTEEGEGAGIAFQDGAWLVLICCAASEITKSI